VIVVGRAGATVNGRVATRGWRRLAVSPKGDTGDLVAARDHCVADGERDTEHGTLPSSLARPRLRRSEICVPAAMTPAGIHEIDVTPWLREQLIAYKASLGTAGPDGTRLPHPPRFVPQQRQPQPADHRAGAVLSRQAQRAGPRATPDQAPLKCSVGPTRHSWQALYRASPMRSCSALPMKSLRRVSTNSPGRQQSNLAMVNSAAVTPSGAPIRSVFLVGQDHLVTSCASVVVLARGCGLLPKLGGKPCKRTPDNDTEHISGQNNLQSTLFSEPTRLPFTQEITGSNPVGGTARIALTCSA
jgi:hypothetical protein